MTRSCRRTTSRPSGAREYLLSSAAHLTNCLTGRRRRRAARAAGPGRLAAPRPASRPWSSPARSTTSPRSRRRARCSGASRAHASTWCRTAATPRASTSPSARRRWARSGTSSPRTSHASCAASRYGISSSASSSLLRRPFRPASCLLRCPFRPSWRLLRCSSWPALAVFDLLLGFFEALFGLLGAFLDAFFGLLRRPLRLLSWAVERSPSVLSVSSSLPQPDQTAPPATIARTANSGAQRAQFRWSAWLIIFHLVLSRGVGSASALAPADSNVGIPRMTDEPTGRVRGAGRRRDRRPAGGIPAAAGERRRGRLRPRRPSTTPTASTSATASPARASRTGS